MLSQGAAGTTWKELLLRNCLQLGPRSLCGLGKSHSLSGLLYSLFLRGASLRRKGGMENTVEEKARGIFGYSNDTMTLYKRTCIPIKAYKSFFYVMFANWLL